MFELGLFAAFLGLALVLGYRHVTRSGMMIDVAPPLSRRAQDEEVLRAFEGKPGVRVIRASCPPPESDLEFNAGTYAQHLRRLTTLRDLLENPACAMHASERARWRILLAGLFAQLDDLARSGDEPGDNADDLRFRRLIRETEALADEIGRHHPPTSVASIP